MIKRSDPTADFCIIDASPDSRLSNLERLTLVGGRELERAMLWIAQQFSSFSPSKALADFDLNSLLSAHQFYSKKEWKNNPSSFFQVPTTAPEVKESELHGLKDGSIVDLEFASQFQPQHPDFRVEYLRNPENLTVHARWWRHNDTPRATLVAVHGWTMGDQRLNSLAFLPGVFYTLGLDVVLIELPYHGRRRSSEAGSANLFPSSDMLRTNEAIGQSISDLRVLRKHLEKYGREHFGVIGMSLGAYISALWASLDPLLFCIPFVPVVSMAELAFEMLSNDPDFKAFKKRGLTLEMLKDLYHVHCPLSHQPIIKPSKVLIIAGLGDHIVPARQPKMLWQHWNKPRIQWYRGGHVAHFKRSQTFNEVIEFLRRLGLANPALEKTARSS